MLNQQEELINNYGNLSAENSLNDFERAHIPFKMTEEIRDEDSCEVSLSLPCRGPLYHVLIDSPLTTCKEDTLEFPSPTHIPRHKFAKQSDCDWSQQEQSLCLKRRKI
jgi:hypothetical protein